MFTRKLKNRPDRRPLLLLLLRIIGFLATGAVFPTQSQWAKIYWQAEGGSEGGGARELCRMGPNFPADCPRQKGGEEEEEEVWVCVWAWYCLVESNAPLCSL